MKRVLITFLTVYSIVGVAYAAEECRNCHPVMAESLAMTEHAAVSSDNNCAICHGEAKSHMIHTDQGAAIIDPGTLGISKGNAICLGCHESKSKDVAERFSSVANLHDDLRCFECHVPHLMPPATEEDIDEFRTDLSVNCAECHIEKAEELSYSSHGRLGMNCSECHKLHAFKTISEDIEEQLEKCVFCHPTQDMEFKYPYAHPLRERQIKCTNCHDPHSNRYEKMLKEEDQRLCEECHADVIITAGNHPESKNTNHSGRTVKCMDCHLPHGSNFDKLLKYSEDIICNTCHQ